MILPTRLEMTTSRADFVRLLPAAVGHVPWKDEGDAFSWHDGQAGWRIGFKPMPRLIIGWVQLERYEVTFTFDGYSEEEQRAFMARFELYFRRGGG